MSATTTPLIENKSLYTREQRERRDATIWTSVQGILAPVQFLAFLISCCLIGKYLITGLGYFEASLSIIIKTFFLLVIMVTGAIWEKKVFDQYLLAPAFFWEDVVSFFVIGLHLFYLLVLFTGWVEAQTQMLIAVCAYILYVINAVQFLIKFKQARTTIPATCENDKEVLA